MTRAGSESTDQLLERASRGESSAVQELLDIHRDRLRRMIAARIDSRLAARIDPSDIVQEALIEAASNLEHYARTRPLPYYPWLRQLAWKHLERAHEKHLETKQRSVLREASFRTSVSDASVVSLTEMLSAGGTSPSLQARREETCRQVRDVLDQMGSVDREILLMHYVEQLKFKDIASVLGISHGSARVRHVRSLEKLRSVLDEMRGDLDR